MNERMLDRRNAPTENEIMAFMGEQAHNNLKILQSRLEELLGCTFELKFPFGMKYGWGYKVSSKKKHLLYLFFEKDSFNLMMKINEPGGEDEINLLKGLSPKGKEYWDNRYPCVNGGWIHYRIAAQEDFKDAGIFLSLRTKRAISF